MPSERIAAATAQYNGQSRPEDKAREWKTCAVDAPKRKCSSSAIALLPQGHESRDEIDMYSALPPIYRAGVKQAEF